MTSIIELLKELWPLVLFVLALCLVMIRAVRKDIKRRRELRLELESPIEDQAVARIGAQVVSKRMEIAYVGTPKHPKHERLFLVAFLTEDGSTVEYRVPEELYAALTEQQIGDLVTVNGEFFDFGDGDPIEEQPDADW